MAEIADIGMTIDKKLRLTLNLQGASLVQLVQLQKNGQLDVILKKHSDKRSLDANAYYWKLLGELAKALQTSNEELHNQLLDSYGTLRRTRTATASSTFYQRRKITFDTSTSITNRPESSSSLRACGTVNFTGLKARASTTRGKCPA
jgi:hypothetical protein